MKDVRLERMLNDRIDRACVWLDAEAAKKPNHDRNKMVEVATYAISLHDSLVVLRSSSIGKLTDLNV